MIMPKAGRARYLLYDRPKGPGQSRARFIWRLLAPNGKILAEKVCQTRKEREESLAAFREYSQTRLVEIL